MIVDDINTALEVKDLPSAQSLLGMMIAIEGKPAEGDKIFSRLGKITAVDMEGQFVVLVVGELRVTVVGDKQNCTFFFRDISYTGRFELI